LVFEAGGGLLAVALIRLTRFGVARGIPLANLTFFPRTPRNKLFEPVDELPLALCRYALRHHRWIASPCFPPHRPRGRSHGAAFFLAFFLGLLQHLGEALRRHQHHL